MRKFLTVSLLAFIGLSALACGPWVRPHYYVFSAYHRNTVENTFYPRMKAFWLDYSPLIKAQPSDIDALSYVEDNFDESDNSVIRAAREKKDTEMLNYLRQLTQYLNICYNISMSWDYPSEEETAHRNRTLKMVAIRARDYSGTRLAPQYHLLVMRCQMVLGEHKKNLAYWNNVKDKLAPSVYKDMMRDIYAGALVNSGNIDEASSIYYELGDMASIMWLKRDERNLEGIKREYARDPKSPSLIFLVQDFVNNASDTRYSANLYASSCPETDNEIKGFIALAQKVLKDGKTDCPALWQSAMGYLNHSIGNSQQGISQLTQAMTMKGTDRMRDNARTCRLVATCESTKPGKQLYDFLFTELKWLLQAERNDAPSSTGEYAPIQNHYSEVLQNIVYDTLDPALTQAGDTNMRSLIMTWMERHDLGDYEGFSPDWKNLLDNLTAQETIDFNNRLGSKMTPFENWLSENTKIEPNYFNDLVGTKMIREGRFQEAIPYLQKVSMSFLNSQPIASYVAARNYKFQPCLVPQYEYRDGVISLKNNQKLEFCRDMIAAKAEFQKATTGAEKAMAAYKIAGFYLQASFRGNCWYLSRYGNSVNDEMCYKEEADFLGEAAHWYETALAQQGISNKDMQLYLYANAWLPYGEEMIVAEYDSNYNLIYKYNKQSRKFKAMVALKQFATKNPNSLIPVVSKCDVLRQFKFLYVSN